MRNRRTRRRTFLFLLGVLIATSIRSTRAFVWRNCRVHPGWSPGHGTTSSTINIWNISPFHINRRSRSTQQRLHRRVSDTVPFFGSDESPKSGNNNLVGVIDAKEEFSRAVRFDCDERSTKAKASDKTDRLESKCPSFEWNHRELISSLDP